MRVALFTKEFPPNVYGGAGVHVDYLSREMAKEIEVEVHCWGPQHGDLGNLHVRGAEPSDEITNGTEGKFKGALEALSLNLTQVKALTGVDVAHTHTWYTSMAGYLAKKLYSVPFVLTAHSLEPLRAWKSEQLGSGYAMSSWMERTGILDADAVIAVSKATRLDILRAYPEIEPERVHVIYNGIDLSEYQKVSETKALTDYGVDPAIPYVLFVGRITRQKGRDLSRGRNSVPAGRHAGRSLCRGGGYAGDRGRDATEGGGCAKPSPANCVDRKNGHETRSDRAVQPRSRLLLPVSL